MKKRLKLVDTEYSPLQGANQDLSKPRNYAQRIFAAGPGQYDGAWGLCNQRGTGTRRTIKEASSPRVRGA